ncbi:MAG: LON peptidase substrate-binding domain-containing protein [Verrucomicrobia bacterium]|nr:LON peptidase substrate-binding domain-containing protein [Verrucomicrobiota bacterium]
MPVMVLPEATLFPCATYPLKVQKPSHVKMVIDALETHRVFALAYEEPFTKKPSEVCGIGLIRAGIRFDKSYHIILQGLARVSLEHCIKKRPYPVYRINPLKEDFTKSESIQILMDDLRQTVSMIVKKMKFTAINLTPSTIPSVKPIQPQKQHGEAPLEDFLTYLRHVEHPGTLADLVASTLVVPGPDRQSILNAYPVRERLKTTTRILCKTYGLEQK